MLAALVAAIQLASPPAAPQARLQAEEGPHFVAVPVRLQVIAKGFEESPQPCIEARTRPRGGL